MKEIQTQRINTYLDALRAYLPEWEALITEKERYTFGELIEAAERVRKHPKEIEEKQGKRHIHSDPGTDDRASAYSVSGIWRRKCGSGDCTVRCKISDELRDVTPPEEAYMGVMTSGTSGRQKVLFRSFESWHDFCFRIKFSKWEREALRLCRGVWAYGQPEPLYGAACVRRSVVAADSFDPRL